eukprot:TRINITY_DN1676_c0_g1_i1.p1 TRINITY_DN1676_c0_g1~~TRINITY_DN1676_c0_g1_i1.p1  ORF type:complete len:188 (+),score=69.31 TRINITY_DN1676_c0_g1_i1:92-655(+)
MCIRDRVSTQSTGLTTWLMHSEAEGFLLALKSGEDYTEREVELVHRNLEVLKPSAARPEDAPDEADAVARALLEEGAPETMAANLRKFPFEARKDVAKLIIALLLHREGDGQPGVEYIRANVGVLDALVHGYDSDSANVPLICGAMLRDLSAHPAISECLLHSPAFLALFSHSVSYTHLTLPTIYSV